MKIFLSTILILMSVNSYAVTECSEKITRYFVGTSTVNEQTAHLWITFEEGGSASVSSESRAYEALLSSAIMALATRKTVTMRYFSDNADCKVHNSDWIGIWVHNS